MRKTFAAALLLVALTLAGCKPDDTLKKGEVIDHDTKPINAPPATAPVQPPAPPPAAQPPEPPPSPRGPTAPSRPSPQVRH